MKINSAILSQRVSDKLTTACISTIAGKAMLNALPLTSTDVVTEATTITQYMTRVIKALHGETLLKRAMESMKDNPNGLNYLIELQDCIVPVVESATKRIVNENSNATPDDLQSIVDHAAFTKDELNTFATKGKNLDLSTISEIVKDKVVKTLKNEKETYEFSKKLENDINEAITAAGEEETPDSPEGNDKESKKPAIESLMDVILTKGDVRKPISFFSRLQDISLETLLSIPHFDGEISLEALTTVTFNRTFDSFTPWTMNTEAALENMLDCAAAPKDSIDIASPKSLIMAIIMLTAFETLKTMRLFDVTVNQMKLFIDQKTEPGRLYNNKSIENHIGDMIGRMNVLLRESVYHMPEIRSALETFITLKDKLNKIDISYLPEKTNILENINAIMTKLEGSMAKANESTSLPTTSIGYFAKRSHENNIAAFDQVFRTMNRRKDVSKVIFELNSNLKPTTESTVVSIPVKAIGIDGMSVVEHYPLYINACEALGSIPEEVFSAASQSKIRAMKDQCNIYFTDKCYSIPLVNEDSL